MTTIETTVDIGPNRQLALQLPDAAAPGRHRVVLHIDNGSTAVSGPQMAAALARLAAARAVEGIADPLAWEREIRQDRQLPGRD